MAPKVCFLGAARRRTMICCRNVKISASSAARDRNRSTTAQTMSLKRYLITDQHCPILGQPPVNRFATGTMVGFKVFGTHTPKETGRNAMNGDSAARSVYRRAGQSRQDDDHASS